MATQVHTPKSKQELLKERADILDRQARDEGVMSIKKYHRNLIKKTQWDVAPARIPSLKQFARENAENISSEWQDVAKQWLARK